MSLIQPKSIKKITVTPNMANPLLQRGFKQTKKDLALQLHILMSLIQPNTPQLPPNFLCKIQVQSGDHSDPEHLI